MLVLNLSSPFWGKQNFKYPKKLSGPFISYKADVLVLKLFLVFFLTILNDRKRIGIFRIRKSQKKKDKLLAKKDVITDAKALLADQEKSEERGKKLLEAFDD